MSEETETTPNRSSARAKAEARRRRILEKSKDRMSVVSGNANINLLATDNVDEPTTTMNVTESTNTESENENTATSTTATDDTTAEGDDNNVTTPSKGSARLAQMRRRRYKKATDTPTKSTTNDVTETEVTNNNNIIENEEKTKELSESTANATETKEDGPPTEKKKYLGVVKMRRKMLAEKKALEAADDNNMTSQFQSKDGSSKKFQGAMKSDKKVISLRPIIVNFLTVILLFLTGFDIGVQNHVMVNQDVPNIHSNYAYSDHGIGAMKLMKKAEVTSKSNVIIQEEIILDQVEEEEEFTNKSEEDDKENEEFSEKKPSGATTSIKTEPNIDPIFGVDFDEMTAGDGIFLAAVRMAVSVHRMLTYIFFTTPLSIFSGILALPNRIFVNPPIMFFCAVIIRYLGKHILGGSLPDLDKMIESEINESDTMKGKENIVEGIANTDFVSMGKNYVTNFIKTNFPKASLAYTVFKDARSDMFIVFCGFFLGLVLPSNLLRHEGLYSVSEEL